MQKIYLIIFFFLFIPFTSAWSQDCTTDPTSAIPCDDGNPCTENDVEIVLDSNGQVCFPCIGTPIDCANGTTTTIFCDDGNPNTINDLSIVLDCDGSVCFPCGGTPVNCANGSTTVVNCDDGDPCTINDVQTVLDADGSICLPCMGDAVNCGTSSTSVVSCDDGNDCTTNDTQTIIDCNGTICTPCMGVPTINCGTGPTSMIVCDDGDPTTINDMETILDCDGTICAPCQGTPMIIDPNNWTSNFSNTNGGVMNNGSVITMSGDTDGTGSNLDNIDCNAADGNVTYCITIPSTGDFTFDWSTPSGSLFNPLVEKFGYCLNDVVTELTSIDPQPLGTSSGTETITVFANDLLCFIASSKFSDGSTPTIYTIENFNFIENPNLITTSIVTTPDMLACFGDTNGSISVTPSGGSGVFTYTWDNANAIGNNPTNLSAGTYCVTVTDDLGNTTEGCTTITEPTELTGAVTADANVSCNGGNDGQATATPTGGTSSYNYNWDNMDTTAIATALSAGNHTVTITDNNGCETTAIIDITEPDTLMLAMSSTPSSDITFLGTATATVGGGTPNYTYSWNTNPIQTTQTAVDLSGQEFYTVTVVDANNCQIIDSVFVVSTVNVNDFSEINHFNIYPNPSSGKVNLEIDLDQKLDIEIRLINSIGQEVITMQLQNTISIRQSFDWEELPKGMYWLSVSSSDKVLVEKISIK